MDSKIIIYIGIFLFSTATHAVGNAFVELSQVNWIHGTKPCRNDQDPPIQVVQAAPSSYVLRQNKCRTFEAPFIYVLFGQNTALVVDTGANKEASESPIFETVKTLFDKHKSNGLPGLEKILVVHSHSHSDHIKGDSQFSGYDYIDVVGTNNEALEKQLGLANWPNLTSSIDLGKRKITFIPIPGHQEQSIAIYDQETRWLLTGDTLYPGLIRVKNWTEFRDSIKRLYEFSKQNPISQVLGAHIEMNGVTKKLYKIGATYQPHELPLALNVSHIEALNTKLQKTKKSKKLKFESFVISPYSIFEKLVIKAATKAVGKD